MKILHTSDWHVGRTLRGMSRLEEHRAVLAEITDLGRTERADLVLVTGDLFDSAAPTPEAQRVVWETLLALRDTGARVVAIGGNHDNQHALDAFAPIVRAAGITLLGHAARPGDGGVIELTTMGMMRKEIAITARMIQPQTARPVAVSAGLCFSTVSV